VTGTGRRTYRRRYSALEIASLALSVFSGASFLLLVWFLEFLDRVTGLPVGEMDGPGLGLVVRFVVLGCFLSTLTALALAAAALLRPGGGWGLPAAAWMIGASVLAYAGAQNVLWTPMGGDPSKRVGLGVPQVHQGMVARKQEAGAVEKGWGPQPADPPEAILSNARRDAAGFEGTFCWAPEWAEDCVRDAGIPLLPEQETITVRQGEAADLVFVLRSSEREFVEGEPMLVGAVAYPLAQEAETVPTPAGVRYLVPDGESRALEKKQLYLEREVELEDPPWSVVVGEVPEGEYIFRISARQHEDVDPSWGVENYNFRVLILPEAGR
jgi:hypothetical protein